MKKTEAIVLRRQEIRETSLVLTAFSRDLGKFQGLVKGVRGARAAVPWYLEPLTLQAVVLYERRRSPWVLVSACDLIHAFDPIRRDLVRLSYASFCLDLVDAMTAVGDPHPEIFELLLSVLGALGNGGHPPSLTRILEARLLKISGLLPEIRTLNLPADALAALQQMVQWPLDRIGVLRLTESVEETLRRLLHGLSYRILERELKSRSFLYSLGLERPVQQALLRPS